MPVFFFALSNSPRIITSHAIFIFIILHLIVYPASNGYNSYMDKDEDSIGGIKNPLTPTRQLFYVTVILDAAAVLLSVFINLFFSFGILIYILASRAYSYRGIRLKKYPVTGYLTVMLFQGAWVYMLVMHGVSIENTDHIPVLGMIAASFLVGGFYPLTQIYQHKQDERDGVRTISMVLGYKGTFICTATIFTLAMGCINAVLLMIAKQQTLIIFNLFFLPTLIYFFKWMTLVFKDPVYADFKHTMQMNIIASVCTNIAFVYLFIQLH